MCFGSKAGDLISQSFLSLQAFAPVENYRAVHSQALASHAAQCCTCHSFIAWFKLSQAKKREKKKNHRSLSSCFLQGQYCCWGNTFRSSRLSFSYHIFICKLPKSNVLMAWHVYAAHAKYLPKATLATHSRCNCGGNKGKAQAQKHKPEHLSPCSNSNRWNTSGMRLSRPEPPADVVAALTGSVSGNFNDAGSRDRGGWGCGGRKVSRGQRSWPAVGSLR